MRLRCTVLPSACLSAVLPSATALPPEGRALYGSHDPYANFDLASWHRPREHRGWLSREMLPVLEAAVKNASNGFSTYTTIIEVGVWKGASTIAMADALRRNGGCGVVWSVDTFLGATEMWLRQAERRACGASYHAIRSADEHPGGKACDDLFGRGGGLQRLS